jgi:hypothetical protein
MNDLSIIENTAATLVDIDSLEACAAPSIAPIAHASPKRTATVPRLPSTR